jgi:hypothetical protein
MTALIIVISISLLSPMLLTLIGITFIRLTDKAPLTQ